MKKLFLLMLAMLFIFSFISCDSGTIKITGGTTAENASSTSSSTDGTTLDKLTDAKVDEILESAVFLGDSTTYGLYYYGVIPKQRVWTPKSGTLTLTYVETAKLAIYKDSEDKEGAEMTIVEAVESQKPEYIVITLGVNGVASLDEERFKKFYEKLLDNISQASENTEIIVNSIYPIAENYDKQDKINNEKISAANIWIEEIANERGLLFIDSYSILCGDDGYMVYEYSNEDGLHLCEKGYRLVVENIKREIKGKYCV